MCIIVDESYQANPKPSSLTACKVKPCVKIECKEKGHLPPSPPPSPPSSCSADTVAVVVTGVEVVIVVSKVLPCDTYVLTCVVNRVDTAVVVTIDV